MKAYEDLVKGGDGVPEKTGADGEPLASAAPRAWTSCGLLLARKQYHIAGLFESFCG